MVAMPSPSPKQPEWQMLVKEFSDDSGTVWTGTIMLKDNSVAGGLGHHSKFQPINADGQSFGEGKLSCHVMCKSIIRFRPSRSRSAREWGGIWTHIPMLCSWTWTGMLNGASVLKEACTKNCSTLLLHGWYLHGSHVVCDCHLCGMRAKSEACSHSDTKLPSTRCGHFFSHSLIGLCIYMFLRAAKTSRTNAFNRLGANTDLEIFLSSWDLYFICYLFHFSVMPGC